MKTLLYTALALIIFGVVPQLAQAGLPEGAIYSDHDAYFEINNTRSGREDTGWYIEAETRVFGDNIPADSGFKYIVKQGRRTLATFQCDARLQQRHLGYDIREGRVGHMSSANHCHHRNDTLKIVGEVAVEVYFIDGNDDSETLLRTHNLSVRSYERVRNSREYYIEVNGEVAATLVHECPRNGAHSCVSRSDSSGSYGYVGVFMWVAETRRNGQSPRADRWGDLTYRCSVDGERVQTTRNDRSPSSDHEVSVQASSGEGRPEERDRYVFTQFHVQLPITVGEAFDGMARLEDHSGLWECQIRRSREVLRTVRFRSADGHILPHAEEVAGNVSLPPGAHLAEVVIPEGASLETRVSPDSTTRGPFFGVGWATDEGRALGTSLPSIGTAALAGEPRTRRRRRRRRR